MYGILNSAVNTGSDAELAAVFIAPLSISSNTPGFALDTVSLKRRASRSPAQRWEIEATIAPTNDSAAFFAHTVVNSFDTVIHVRMPQVHIAGHGVNGISRKTPVGAPISQKPGLLTDGVFPAGTSVINIKGLGRFEMMVGEFIKFVGDNKVYLVTEAGVNGVGTRIFPSLRKNKTADVQILYGDSVTMLAYYDTDSHFGIRYQDGILTEPGTIRLVEAL